jgi:hypothetical protein
MLAGTALRVRPFPSYLISYGGKPSSRIERYGGKRASKTGLTAIA